MRYRLRTLLIALALGPPVLAALAMVGQLMPVNLGVIALVAYLGLAGMIIIASKLMESPPAEQTDLGHQSYQYQNEVFSRQSEETDRQLAEQERSIRKADELMRMQESSEQRMQRLLDKLEDQARRKDAILEAEERQLGFKS